MKRFPVQAAWILLLWVWGSGCGESIDGRLSINLVSFCEPSLAELQANIKVYCIRVQTLEGREIDSDCSEYLERATLKVDETTDPIEVVVGGWAGSDVSQDPLVRGRSVPVKLKSGEDNVLSIPIATVGRFALVAGGVGTCRPLPYLAADHAATVFPSGHVLITGSSSPEVDDNLAAFLIDPVSGVAKPLQTPASLHRAYHSATLLEDGRVVILGGESPAGVTPREIAVSYEGHRLMQTYSFADFDPHDPPSLSFDLLSQRLLNSRVIHDAARFHGDQIIINDGGTDAEMFLGFEEASGFILAAGSPFPVSNQFIVTTVVPLDESRGVLLGGEANHNGLLTVRPNTREVEFQPYNLPVVRRNRPLGLRLHDGRVIFLGGKEGMVNPESPVVLVDPAVPSLIEIFVDSRTFPQRGYTATLLEDGRVFVAGGTSTDGNYDPSSTFYLEQDQGNPDRWFAIPGPDLNLPRSNHTASLLPDGRLLVVGGLSARAGVSHEEVAASAEIIAF
jgi:hypothetical protein